MGRLKSLSISLWAGHGLAAICGALIPLAFAPIGWYVLVMPAIAGLLFLTQGLAPKPSFWRGWWFGVGMFGAGVSWVMISVHVYGQAMLVVAVLVMLLFVAVLALFPAMAVWASVYWVRGPVFLRTVVAFPAAWVLFEWSRGWVFSGFPWLDLGYSQIDASLAGLAPLLGEYGVGLAVVMAGGALFAALQSSGLTRWGSIGLLVAMWCLPLLVDKGHWQVPAGDPFKVALVQGSIPQEQKWAPTLQQATLEKYMQLSEAHWDADLMVWPETAIPMFYDQVEHSFIPHLQAQAQSSNTDMLVGVPYLDRQGWQVFNAVLALGDTREFYFKRHLVPFGEFLPFRKLLGSLLEFLVIPLGDFTPGAQDQPLQTVVGYAVGASVCYEVAFGRDINRALPEAALLVNVSNDGWFGDSLAPHQHLEMARMRALETGRYLLRATNTGISAVIDSVGNVVAESRQFEPAIVRATIVPMQGATPYVRMGNGPVIGLCLIMFGIAVVFGRRSD